MNTEYNGWTNYETWAASLHITNEQHAHDYWRARAREVLEDQADEADAISVLADELKDNHEEAAPELAGVYSDLLQAALDCINWREIAKHIIEGTKE